MRGFSERIRYKIIKRAGIGHLKVKKIVGMIQKREFEDIG